MNMKLTPFQITRLAQLESIIEKGKETFIEVGSALVEIRERRLYLRDYSTFDVYCHEKWGFSRQRAHQLINAAVAIQGLPKEMSTTVDTERVAREVSRVDPSMRPKVLTEARRNGPVTAKSVREAAAKVVKPAEPERTIVRDEKGCVIPDECHEFWSRRQEIQDLITQVSRLRSSLRKLKEDDDPLYRDMENMIFAHLDGVYHGISKIKPHAVCLHCQGHPNINKTPCPACRGRGIVPKFVYEFANDSKLRQIREKSL